MIKIYGTCIVGAIAWCAVAQAQPYANIEMNRIYPQGSYVTTQYEMQVGYKKKNEKSSWYATVGPVATDTQFTKGVETQLGGFIGGDIKVDDDVSFYGEIFGTTDETVIIKTGAEFTF